MLPLLISTSRWLCLLLLNAHHTKPVKNDLIGRVISAIALLCFTCISKANEQTSQENALNSAVDINSPIVKDDFEWQIMLDLSLAYDPVILKSVRQTEPLHFFKPVLLIDISYKGFFIQSNQRRAAAVLSGLEFGYQLVVKEYWQLDIIAKSYMFGYNPHDLIQYADADKTLFSGLADRDPTFGVALRYSQHFDNALFTIDFARANTDADAEVSGLIIESFYSYLLPYRNWDIYLGAGLTYYDQNLVDYYTGITPDEVTENRPSYTAGNSLKGQLEIYAQYPLSANWSFNTGITQTFYDNKIKRSPLVDKNKLTQVMVGVLYVF